MFTGHGGRERRRVDLSGRKADPVSRNDILENARIMRMERELERHREFSAAIIQKVYRSHRTRHRAKEYFRTDFDSKIAKSVESDVLTLRNLLCEFLFFYAPSVDTGRLQKIAELLVSSIRQKDLKKNYIQLLLIEESSRVWLIQMRKVFVHVFNVLLENFTPALASVVFLIISPEHWPFRPSNADSASASILDFALKREASVALRACIMSKFPLDATKNIDNPSNLRLLLLKSCLKLVNPQHGKFFVRDILTIPSLFSRPGVQGVQTLYSRAALSVLYETICCENGCIVSEITSKHGTAGEPCYPSVGWLMGNIVHLSMPSIETEAEDVQLFSTLSTLVLKGPKSIFPSSLTVAEAEGMREDDDEDLPVEFVFDRLHPLLKQQLSFLTDQRFLNAIVRAVRSQNGLSETFFSATTLLHELLRVWQGSRNEILSLVTFGTSVVRTLWDTLSHAQFEKYHLLDYEAVCPSLSLFSLTYGHYLKVIDDEEFHTDQTPFYLADTIKITLAFRTILVRLFWTDGDEAATLPWACYLREAVASTFQQLRDRQSRKPFAEKAIFVMPDHINQEFNQKFQQEFSVISNDGVNGEQIAALEHISDSAPANCCFLILNRIPVIVPFYQRVQIFYRLIRMPEYAIHHNQIEVRRNFLLEDAFSKFMALGDRIKGSLRVSFVDEFGLNEAGIDGGGLFKEFLNVVSKQALDPQTGMFNETLEKEHYPSPISAICREDHLKFFKFVGIIVGKLLSSGIQIEPRFANFFLRKLASVPTCIDDLKSLDPEISKNLLFLKKFDGNFEDLGLFFCVINDELGQKQVVDLCPGGSSIPVTKTNRLAFMHQLADYKLNRQLRFQTNAFISGLELIIPRRCFQMFSPDEIQMLISGSNYAIDIDDMKRNMKYTGFSDDDILIEWFWEVLSSMSSKDLSLTLRFFTSCSRAPLLGFSSLSPGLCLQKSLHADPNALPSSSTCVNMMRIPPYASKSQMQEKIIYAIRSNAGFDLS